MNRFKNKKLVFSIAILVLVLAIGLIFTWLGNANNRIELSGIVQAKEVKNASRFGGRIEKILVDEGQTVEKGQILITFDNIELSSKISEAKAALTQAQSKAELLAKGADSSELRQARAQVQQAEERLRILSSGARPEEIVQAESKVEVLQGQYENAKKAYENGKTMLSAGIISQQKMDELTSGYEAAKSGLDSSKAALKMLKTGARSEEVRIAKSQLASARAQYDKVTGGAKREELDIAYAAVEQAESLLNALQGQLREVELKSPISGVVSVISVSEGELVQPNRPVVSIIDYDALWTDVYVPESKLSFVKVGQKVTIKASAHPNAQFQGRVAMVNPKGEFVPSSGGANVSEESTFRVKVLVNNRDVTGQVPLYPGMKVDVIFTR